MSEQKDVMVIGPERETDKASDESSKWNNDNNKCKYKEDNIYMIDEDLAKERVNNCTIKSIKTYKTI